MTKLKWGMIGGGEGSQIGPAHRLGAQADGNFYLVAGALDHRPAAGRDYAQRLGVAADRAYGDWKEMLAGERGGATGSTSSPSRHRTPRITKFRRPSLRPASMSCAKSR